MVNVRISLKFLVLVAAVLTAGACSSSGGLIGPADETQKAVELVSQANADLRKIRILYKENEGKRLELKNALESDSAAEVERLTNEVVQIINDGTNLGTGAVDLISEAQMLNIHRDYKEYLRLKEEALRLQLSAFDNYRQAARTLRDNYDPKNAGQRDKVKSIFEERSEAYRKIMEEARDASSRANELYKETLQREKT